jgi:hypothetical protein
VRVKSCLGALDVGFDLRSVMWDLVGIVKPTLVWCLVGALVAGCADGCLGFGDGE